MSYIIAVPLPSGHDPGLLPDFLMQMAYCDPVIETYAIENADGMNVVVVTVPRADGADIVERKVKALAGRILGSGKKAPTLIREKVFDVPNMRNIEEDLAREGLVRRIGPGLYHLSGICADLFNHFDAMFRDIASRLGAVEEYYPPFISVGNLKRLGFFDSTPQYATFLTHLKEDVDLIDTFAAEARGSAEPSIPNDHGSLATLEFMMAATVCCHAFACRSDSTIPNGLVTARNVCTRYEGRNLAHLNRLWAFNMREIIIFGDTPQYAEDGRRRILEETESLLQQYRLDYRTERANDLFFDSEFGKRAEFQRGLGLKIEIRLTVPATRTSVACASFNLHHSNFGKRNNIASPSGRPIHSACVGFGIERWVYCFLQQHGLDPQNWPKPARAAVRKR